MFFRKILVPGNGGRISKTVSQIFRRRQIGPICRQPVAPTNLGNKFHFYEPIWKRLFSNSNQFEKGFFQIRTNLKKAFFKLVHKWSTDLLSFSTQNRKKDIKTNGENKHISCLFPKNVFTVSLQLTVGKSNAQKRLYNFTISEPFWNNSSLEKSAPRSWFFGLYKIYFDRKRKLVA